MGEARRRRDLGLPPRTTRCPAIRCRSRRVELHGPDSRISAIMAGHWQAAPTTHGRCLDCGEVWEVIPDGWRDDAVERAITMGPCDNCAYRGTSRETSDPEERAKLLALAEEVAHRIGDGVARLPRGQFACHKGIPITLGPDGIEYDFAAAGIDPAHHSCAGWLRVLWAGNGAKVERRRVSGQ